MRANPAIKQASGTDSMDLLDLQDNPIPSGTVLTPVTTADGITLRACRFPATLGPPRGTVCLFQGRAEQVEKYFPVVEQLRRRGFAVVAFDWRGQGGSSRLLRNPAKGHVADFLHYERDIDAIRRQIVLPDCPPPYFALGHSMGATVLLRAAPRLTPWLSRIVLVAPLLDFGDMPVSPGTVRHVAGVLGSLGFSRLGVPGAARRITEIRRFDGNPLTSDPERFRIARDIATMRSDLAVGPPTIGWLRAAARAMKAVEDEDFPGSVPVPVMLVNCGADRVVSVRAVERMARRLRSVAYVLVPGARHEILHEADRYRTQFWAAFDAFVPGTVEV